MPAASNPSTTVTPPPAAGASQAQQQVSGQAEHAQRERQGRIIRGSQLIGLNIRGSDDHQLGIVRDFIVDSQGECPMIYFAVEPDASLQLGQEYVIMPYSAMRYDSRGGRNYFALDVIGTGLRNAPRVAVNGWSTFNDRQLLSNAHQFYQRTERTTARPIQGGAEQPKEQGTLPETPTRPDGSATPQPEIAPRLDTTTQPKTTPQPESETHPAAARPAAAQPEATVQPASGRPTPAPAPEARPDSKAKEPVEQVVPRR
ncbi:MAG: PRC-barrel domain-containing protein [Thermoguttaceae bacterium]